jgi:hypothetical protein
MMLRSKLRHDLHILSFKMFQRTPLALRLNIAIVLKIFVRAGNR